MLLETFTDMERKGIQAEAAPAPVAPAAAPKPAKKD
jgi:hypothetical protein